MEAVNKSFNEIINGQTPVLVDFHAEWCGPCKMMAPILKEVKQQMGEKVTIIKIDVDRSPQTAAHYQVQGVPTLILFHHGQIKWRQSGVVPAQQLKTILSREWQ